MKKKAKDLQPWLDYFAMLQEYERNGYLEVGRHDKATDEDVTNEAYVTRSALMTLAGITDVDVTSLPVGEAERRLIRETPKVVRCVRTYAGWRSREGVAFLDRPFALHVVREDEPHDLLYTVVLTVRRRWWKPWTKSDRLEVVSYG